MALSPILTFISHMVQIKQLYPCNYCNYCYNFISHMVQIKLSSTTGRNHTRFGFYIPYGSNKTTTPSPFSTISNNFISHMVQIKRFQCFAPSFVKKVLYPIWFK